MWKRVGAAETSVDERRGVREEVLAAAAGIPCGVAVARKGE